LKSALAQPESTFGGELLHPTIAAQASAYLFHISKNHPFVDGNKRTAFAVMDVFLRFNSYRPSLTNAEKCDLVLRVAQGDLNKEDLIELLTNQIVPQ